MTFGLDTSVVLRLLTGEPPELAARALERYQQGIANGDDFAVSDVVAAETYYALQHHYNKTKEESLAALMALSGERTTDAGRLFSFSRPFSVCSVQK